MANAKGIDSIADELYGLPLEEFTATRTTLEKQARDGGDRDLAAQIKALGKPNVAAWLLNQLARRRTKELEPLIALGAELREATRALAGDRLRELSKQQHVVVQGLLRQARDLAGAEGQAVSETVARGVQDTLHAALVDEQAADELLAGRLTTTLQRSGLGDGTALPTAKPAKRAAPASAPAKAPATAPKRSDAKAERALVDATKTRDAAKAKATSADEAADEAQAEVERLRAELESARAAAATAEKRRREAAGTLRRAERALDDVQRRRVRR